MKKLLHNLKLKKILKKGSLLMLTEEEKSKAKENLIITTEKHPVRNSETARHTLQRSFNFLERLKLTPTYKPMTVALVIALMASLGGGVSFAAQDSLPNEALYPIKVHVNERVESAIAFSDEAEADVQVKQIERRLTEATELAVNNELETDTEAKIEARMQRHINVLTELQEKFEARGKVAKSAEVSARLDAILQTHNSIFAGLNGNTESVAKIKAKVKEHTDASAKATAEADAEAEAETSAEVKANSAQTLMNVAKKRVEITERFAQRHNLEVSGEAQAQLEAANTLIAQGETELEAETYSKAFATFKTALHHAQKAHSLLAVNMKLNLHVEVGDDSNNESEEENNEEGEEELEGEAETEVEVQGSTNGNGAGANGRAKAEVKIGF